MHFFPKATEPLICMLWLHVQTDMANSKFNQANFF